MVVTIDSRSTWVRTGVLLSEGTTYRLTVTGRWKDASVDTDAAGYSSVNVFQRVTQRLRRMPDAPWFALVGAIDSKDDTQFLISTGCTYTATANGELTCFANDLKGFYGNNSGSVSLTIEALRL